MSSYMSATGINGDEQEGESVKSNAKSSQE